VDRALICLHETMVEITAKCGKSASIELWNYATSILWGIASNIWAIYLHKSTNPCT
jgi:hypothetical protein